jgi:hypothetical protein
VGRENEGGKNEGARLRVLFNDCKPEPHLIDFEQGELSMPTVEETEEKEARFDNPTHKLLLYHYQLPHESFDNLQQIT